MARWIKIHVIATSIIGAQLVVWAVTGFAFTLFDFRVVRGSDDRAPAARLDVESARLTPGAAATRAEAARPGSPHRVKALRLSMVDGHAAYDVSFTDDEGEQLIEASSGALLSIDPAAAERIACAAFRGPVAAHGVEPRQEDGRAVFVVSLDDPGATEVTIDAATGEISSWHNRTWRRFDALWSLHVLGYLNRSSPAHWPLRVVGFLATLAVGSGAGLLILRTWRRARRRLRSART